MQSHELAEVNVCNPSVVADDEHVFMVCVRAWLAEIRRTSNDDRLRAERIDEHVFCVNPVNPILCTEISSFLTPAVETVSGNIVTNCHYHVGQIADATDVDLRLCQARAISFAFHQGEAQHS